MSTTSTAPTVCDAFVDAVNDDLTAPVAMHHTWPGGEATDEMFVLGDITWDEYRIPTIKNGRQQRQENYTVDYELTVLNVDSTTPTDPTPARDRAFTLHAVVEDLLALDTTAGTSFAVVQKVELKPETAYYAAFDNGFGFRIAGKIEVQARLR